MAGAIGAATVGAFGARARRGNSFTPSTLVRMADGSRRPIRDVTIGDKVASTEPETGETAAKPVVQIHLNRDHEFVDVTVNTTPSTATRSKTTPSTTTLVGPVVKSATKRGGLKPALVAAMLVAGTAAVVSTTQHHRFWDQTSGTWTFGTFPGREQVPAASA